MIFKLSYLGPVKHLFRLEHHTHERSCYAACDHSYGGDTNPRPQEGKHSRWNGLRNSITVAKRKQFIGKVHCTLR